MPTRPSATQKVLFSSAPQASSGGALHRQREALGHVSPRAPQQHRPARGGAHHRVVGPRLDRAVVHQEGVRDAVEAAARVLVLVGDRLVRHVRARHHERGRRHRPAAGGAAASRAASRPGPPSAGPPIAPPPPPPGGGRSRSAAPARPAGARPRARGPPARARPRATRPSARRAGPRGACAPAAPPPPAPAPRGRPGDSPPRPFTASTPPAARTSTAAPSAASPGRASEAHRRPAVGARVRLGVEAAVGAGRGTRPRSARTSESRPWW